MTDLSRFADGAFDVVLNPVSVIYVDDVHSVWRECYRVLKPGGRLMMGSINPLNERAPSINRYCSTYFATLALKLL